MPLHNPSFAQNLMLEKSPASVHDPIHVLIVMDGLVELSTGPLEWVLKNVASEAHCTITLLGVMPWLNIPLSAKTWSEIWSMNLGDLSNVKNKNTMSDLKYQKVHRLLDLCQQYGVVPEIRTGMGHPLRLLVVEQIISLHASVVVFDRHHERKNIEFYAEKVPCHMVVMNDDEAEVEIIKGRFHFDSAHTTPLPSATPTPDVSDFIKRVKRQE